MQLYATATCKLLIRRFSWNIFATFRTLLSKVKFVPDNIDITRDLILGQLDRMFSPLMCYNWRLLQMIVDPGQAWWEVAGTLWLGSVKWRMRALLDVKMLAGDYPGPGDSLSLIRPSQSATLYTWVVAPGGWARLHNQLTATEPPYVCSRFG